MKINGVNVKDADHKIQLVINLEDVRIGARKNAGTCAAAHALCRQEHCDEARMHFSRAYIRKGRKWLRFGVPRALRDEIMSFDRGGTFAPGEYRLSPLQPTVRLDRPKPKRYDNKTNKVRDKSTGTKIKRPYHVVAGVRARMLGGHQVSAARRSEKMTAPEPPTSA